MVFTTHYRRLTEFDLSMWQAEADTELTLSAWPATAVGQILIEYGSFSLKKLNASTLVPFSAKSKTISRSATDKANDQPSFWNHNGHIRL